MVTIIHLETHCSNFSFPFPVILQEISSFTLEQTEDGGVKMETGKGKCPFEPSQHYTAVMAGETIQLNVWLIDWLIYMFVCCLADQDIRLILGIIFRLFLYFVVHYLNKTLVCLGGTLYTAATSNFLGTLFDISRATGPEQERIRTERSINWLSGETHMRVCTLTHLYTPPIHICWHAQLCVYLCVCVAQTQSLWAQPS